MNVRRAKLALAVLLVTLLPTPAQAVPVLGLSLTVDPICPQNLECGFVTAELVRSYGTGTAEDTRGVFLCAAVVPGATRVIISCTYEDTTATDVSGLPLAAVALGTIGGDGGPSEAQLCMHVSADLPTGVRTYDKCFQVLNIGS